MNTKKKKILAIISLLLIMVFAGAAVMVSYRLNSQQKVAPNAPESEPMAAELQSDTTAGDEEDADAPSDEEEMALSQAGTKKPLCGKCTTDGNCASGLVCDERDGRCKKDVNKTICWVTSAACVTTAKVACVPTDVIVCEPDCPTECGLAASTIKTCKNSCGAEVSKQCPATNACENSISITKKAFKNEVANTAGNYSLTTEIDTVSKNQTFVYTVYVKNTGAVKVTGAVLTDTLNGENQDELTFVDMVSGCSFSTSEKKITCNNISLDPGVEAKYSFRVTVSNGATNGETIKNVAVVTLGETSQEAEKTLAISTIVGCNHVCTGDDQCSSGLVCDTSSSKCRKAACTDSDTCTCPPAPTETPEPTAQPTAKPTAQPTARPTGQTTLAPTTVITEAPFVPATPAQPTALPEAGILDIPGVAAFGGGLLLAIVGILLAL